MTWDELWSCDHLAIVTCSTLDVGGISGDIDTSDRVPEDTVFVEDASSVRRWLTGFSP